MQRDKYIRRQPKKIAWYKIMNGNLERKWLKGFGIYFEYSYKKEIAVNKNSRV